MLKGKKTIIFNTLSILLLIGTYITETNFMGIDPHIIVLISSVINLYLRTITNTRVNKKE